MPRCAWCEQIKTVDAFGKVYAGMLRVVCRQCERYKLTYCGFCGLPVREGKFYRISDRLNECMDCHEQTLALIRKNELIRAQWKLNQVIKQTNRMSEHLIGNLRERLFRTMDGLEAGTITVETAAQITDVARAIIESARVENEFVKLTGTNGSGFIPVLEGPGDAGRIGPPDKKGR